MNNYEKFSVVCRQAKTLDFNPIEFEWLNFADGSIRVNIKEDHFENVIKIIEHTDLVIIDAYFTSMDDLMIVSQLKDIIKRHVRGLCDFRLKIRSPMYSRYDRVMFENKLDSFGANVYAQFIGAMGFDKVFTVDCHSETLIKLISAYTDVEDIKQMNCLASVITSSSLKTQRQRLAYIIPDKGAMVKCRSREASPYVNVVFDKVRNPETGVIESIEPVENAEFLKNDETTFLVIDDLCEGGGTFMGIANRARQDMGKNSKLNLYVTHGLFTGSAIQKLLTVYDEIFAYQMQKSKYDSLTKEQQARVQVYALINY